MKFNSKTGAEIYLEVNGVPLDEIYWLVFEEVPDE